MVLIQTEDFDAASLIAELRERAAGQAGAMVSFIGTVRDYAPNAPTQTLFLDHYPGMCQHEIESICAAARDRWDIIDTTVVHRMGALQRGEQIVFVGVIGPHRGEVFKACEYIIDALKTRAPFWKRETLQSGEQFWVGQHETDAQKTADWELEE
ncbi:MAG: molybdenum cofactor biosynthesis protein MoaE [Alcaligenaceae bacterium]|nr:molybdenum cofactor biosynthesis protein MoaE [Alcaligenaceae bacterium]